MWRSNESRLIPSDDANTCSYGTATVEPAAELEAALERGDLSTAAGFLPLIARDSPREFDAYALRWLGRWITETPTATIEQAAEIAGALADLPVGPTSFEAIRGVAWPASLARRPCCAGHVRSGEDAGASSASNGSLRFGPCALVDWRWRGIE